MLAHCISSATILFNPGALFCFRSWSARSRIYLRIDGFDFSSFISKLSSCSPSWSSSSYCFTMFMTSSTNNWPFASVMCEQLCFFFPKKSWIFWYALSTLLTLKSSSIPLYCYSSHFSLDFLAALLIWFFNWRYLSCPSLVLLFLYFFLSSIKTSISLSIYTFLGSLYKVFINEASAAWFITSFMFSLFSFRETSFFVLSL